MSRLRIRLCFSIGIIALCTGCPMGKPAGEAGEDGATPKGRAVMFIGMDISGSFMNRWMFDDSIRFLAHYIYGHLKGQGGMAVPSDLFVGSIGGAALNEPKTFYPIQTFEHRTVAEIEAKLREIFPKRQQNPFTDYNAFFNQISVFVKNKKLVLRPITIVMISDGIPDVQKTNGEQEYRSIKLRVLENLARDITVRVLYTSAVVGMNWQTKVPRERVKIWTQDAEVMRSWKDRHIMQAGLPFSKQDRFFKWVKDNVDFSVPRKRVN